MSEEQFEEPLIFVASQIEMLHHSDLIERDKNSKNHPPEQIARLKGAIREFGFTVPLLVDNAGNIIAGHGRKLAGLALGMRHFPCVRAGHLTGAQIDALVLFDNKIAETGFDPALLRVEIEGLKDIDEELLGLTGFSDKELDEILADLEPEPEKDKDKKKPPELRFGEHKIPMSAAEAKTLDALVEMHLSKHDDLIGFVEETLLRGYQ